MYPVSFNNESYLRLEDSIMSPTYKCRIYVYWNIPNSTATWLSFGPRRTGTILLRSRSDKRKDKCISVDLSFFMTSIYDNMLISCNKDSNSYWFTFTWVLFALTKGHRSYCLMLRSPSTPCWWRCWKHLVSGFLSLRSAASAQFN